LTKYADLGNIHPTKAKLKELANLNDGKEVAPNWFPLASEAGAKLESISAVDKYPITRSLPNGDTKRDTDGAIMAKTAKLEIGRRNGSAALKSEMTGINHLLIRPAQKEDHAKIRDFLLESSALYPEIGHWWKNRVCPTIEHGKRIVLVVDSGRSLEGLFIGKIGESAKLCTLRLRESVRNQGIGRVLVAEGLRHLLRSEPSRFHVTVSEGAEEGCAPLFESIGFRRIAVQKNRYLPGVDEFIYSCEKDEIVEAVNNELSLGMERTLFGAHPRQMPNENTLLMSLKPEFAELILRGHKTIEFRRKFSKKYQGASIVFYVTQPVKRFMFMAVIEQVDHQQKTRLWNTHKHHGGISEDLFDRYFAGTDFGYAIKLSNIRNIPNQLDLKRAQQIYPQLRPPQSFQRLERRSPLMRALDLPIFV
jgi:predicted transcriptional regulator/ribosomal protein S18 acetylase RimI-like enzyme